MNKICKNNGLDVYYKINGEGNPVVLIHGYLETSEVWGDFAFELSSKYKVISVDLPGHGKSELYDSPYTMCKYAESVNAVLEHEKIEKAFIVGHSMGGYVAMAFAENYPEKLKALCLFHSHPFGDSEEKKQARNITIGEYKAGKKEQIIKAHTQNLFAKENIKIFEKEIEKVYTTANKIEISGIIASLKSMRDRKDRCNILKALGAPFLLIHGDKDNFILNGTVQKIEFPKEYMVQILKESGHAGFIEEKDLSIKILSGFLGKVF